MDRHPRNTVMRWPIGLAMYAAVCACGSRLPDLPDAARDDAPPADAGMPDAGTAGNIGAVGRFEAEAMQLTGGAAIVGSADHSARAMGDVAGEASQRQAVTLATAGDAVAFTVTPDVDGATGVVVRFSLPDATAGGGQQAQLALTTQPPGGGSGATEMLTLTSRYAWEYGTATAVNSHYNVPAIAVAHVGSAAPLHVYDEIQVLLAQPLAAGTVVTLSLPSASPQLAITIDFAELEVVAPPLAKPANLWDATQAPCTLVGADVRATGRAFDGVDDSSYASVFATGSGSNPIATGPTGEQDWYTNAATDALQDKGSNAVLGGQTMFALADANFTAIKTCLASAVGSGSDGIWIPPGRYYVRGSLNLPSHATIRGAGMWYAKFAAVDTSPPAAKTINGIAGSASTSGDFKFHSNGSATTDSDTLSDFAMFGNATERDTPDSVTVHGIDGEFTNSSFTRIWVEHYGQGIVIDGESSHVTIDSMRVRNTMADGIDFYGNTSSSMMTNSQARSTGDDGFAIWSQGASETSTGNVLASSTSELAWFGDGFAIYGGSNVTVDVLTASDTVVGPGIKLSTEFVPTDIGSGFTMSGVTVANVTLHRCGGNFGGQALAAVQISDEVEPIDGMTIAAITVDDPTFGAFDIRYQTDTGSATPRGEIAAVAISNSQVTGGGSASACAQVGSGETGSAALTNVCVCDATGSASKCDVNNESTTTFTIKSDTCAETVCN